MSTIRKFWFDHNMSTTAMILSKISQSLWFDHNIYLVMHFGPF